MSSQPPQQPGHPRSTPIPGGDDGPMSPSDFAAGGGGAQPPPPPGFGGGPTSFPAGFPGAPGAAFPPGNAFPPGSGYPGAGGFPGGPGMGGPGFPGMGGPGFPGGPVMGAPFVIARRKRSGFGLFFLFIMLIGPVVGVGIVILAVTKTNSAVNQANDFSDPRLSKGDRSALGLDATVQTFFEAPAEAAVVSTLDARIGGGPTEFTQIGFYTDYTIVSVQAPDNPAHIDEYTWRNGGMTGPAAQSNDSELDAKLFTVADVQWAAVGAVVEQAPTIAKVEQGTVSHVLVERNDFDDAKPVVVRIYVSGPRSSAFIEVDPSGKVLGVH